MDRSRHDKACRDGDGVGIDINVGGRLKQRLARILLHSSCTTTSATAFVTVAKANASPATTSRREPPPATGPCAHEPRPKIDGSRRGGSRNSVRALVDISIDCPGLGAGATTSAARRSVGPALLHSPTPAKDVRAVKSKARKGNGDKPRSPSYRFSCSSSTFTDGELAPFSSDGERGEEAETRSTLFSSLSFSSDSTSDFYTRTRRKHRRKPPRRAPRGTRPADVFRQTVAAHAAPAPKHGKDAKKADNDCSGMAAAGGMAVVKQSRNPYADFRSSMVEMIVERRISGADAMGELLVSYLSLNSPRHHPAILAAFEAVREAVFFDRQAKEP